MSPLEKKCQQDALLEEQIYFARQEMYELLKEVTDSSYIGEVRAKAEKLIARIEGYEESECA